jgi:hypothetical protein
MARPRARYGNDRAIATRHRVHLAADRRAINPASNY